MIFKTKTDDFGRLKTGLNDGIKDAVTGIFNGNFFKRQNLLSDSDITAIKAYNAEIDKCTTSQTAFYRTMQNTSKEAQNVVAAANGNKVALDGLTKSSKAAELGMKALSMAGNMLLMWGISEAITIIYDLATASDRLQESASQLGNEFANTKSDIDDYKGKIEELYQTINNDTSSYEDTYNARQELLKIQDEMIDKFGDEADAVKLVTDAINGQTDSLDTLTQDKWQETVNAFNSDRDKKWTEKVADAFANIGHGNNFQRMLDEMEDTEVTFHIMPMYGDETYEEFSKKLKEDFGASLTQYERDDAFTLSGDLDDIYKQLLNIQNLAKDMGIDDTFLKDLGDQADEAKGKLEDYQEIYSQHVLYDKIFNSEDYEKSFDEINKAYEKYQDAFASGDEEAIEKAKQNYAEIVQGAIEGLDDQSVIDYFNNMYPDLQEIVGDWEFEVKFKAAIDDDKDDFENEVKDAVSQFNTVEDIKNYNPKVATEEQKNAYLQLKQYADDYGLTLDQLIAKLEQMGLLQSQSKSDLLNKLIPSKSGLTAGVSSALSDAMAGVDADEATKWVDSLTDEEAKLANSKEFENALEEQKKKLNGAALSAGDYETALQSVKDAQNQTSDETPIFSLSETQSKSIDDFESKVKTLSSALSTLRSSGELDGSTYTDLIQDFPVLAEESGDLEEAIKSLIEDALKDVYETLGQEVPDNLKNSLRAIADEALNVKVSLKDAFSDIQKTYDAMNDFKDAMSGDGLTDSILNTVSGLSEELNNLVAGFYAGTVSAEKLFDALGDQYETDLQNYSNALIEKNKFSGEFYSNVGLSSTEVINHFKDDYGIDIDNCKSYNTLKAKIELETLGKISRKWSQFYDLQTQQLTGLGAYLKNQADSFTGQTKENFLNQTGFGDFLNELETETESYKQMMDDINKITYDGIGSSFEKTSKKISELSEKASKSSKSSSNDDPIKDAFEKEYNLLKHNLEMEKITEEEYYNGVEALNNKYFKGKKKYLDEYRQYEEEVYKGLQSYYKSYCDDMLDYYKKSLEANQITFKRYSKNVKKFLEDMWKSGKISAKDYYEYVENYYESQKDIYDKVISAVVDRFDEEIDKIDKTIDKYNDLNDKLEEQKTQYENAASAVVDYYDKLIDNENNIIDSIEDANDAVQEQIDKFDSLINVADRLYEEEQNRLNDEKDALQDKIDLINAENDAKDLQYRKEQALYELERAQQQRTKKIYTGEKGFIYDTDKSAISDAKNNVESIKTEELISSLEKEKDALQDSIDALQKYRDALSDISDAYDKLVDERNVIDLVGTNYKDVIFGTNVDDWDKLKDKYISVKDTITNNEDLIKASEDKIKAWEKEKEQWSSLTNLIQQETNAQAAAKLLGANWEQRINEGRFNSYNDFKNKYLNIQRKINDNTNLIESLEEKKANYENLKNQWSSLSDEYEKQTNRQYAEQILGANWESDVLSGRKKTLSNFKDNYISIQESMSKAAWDSANAQIAAINAVNSAQTGSSNTTSNNETPNASKNASTSTSKNDTSNNNSKTTSTKTTTTTTSTKTTTSTANTKWTVIDSSTGAVLKGGLASSSAASSWASSNGYSVVSTDSKTRAVRVKKKSGSTASKSIATKKNNSGNQLKAYASGTQNAKRGINLVGEKEPEAFVDNSGNVSIIEKPTLIPMEGGERVFSGEETKEMISRGNLTPVELYKNLDLAKSAFNNIPVPNFDVMNSLNKNVNIPRYNNATPSVVIGDIHLHEVQNVPDFAKALQKELPGISVRFNGRH